MKIGIFLIALIFTNVCFSQNKLTKVWETEANLKVPESAIYDKKSKAIYVANIDGKAWEKDGKGFISKIDISGKIQELEWINGLDAPKGMGIYKGKLYVTDIDKVVVIDIKNKQIENRITVAGAMNLNDITIDKLGNVYISDSGNKKIFVITNGVAIIWLENPIIQKPNGLLALKSDLRLMDMGTGIFYSINYSDKKLVETAKNLTSGDGIVQINAKKFLISNWNGEVSLVNKEKVSLLLDTKASKTNAADIWYIKSEKLVLVPTFYKNTLVAYKLSK